MTQSPPDAPNPAGPPSSDAAQGDAARGAWRLAFSYDGRADRLGLSVGTGPGPGTGPNTGRVISLALTRRLTARLIDGFAQLLERTSAAAAAAPSDMREDIILLEHQSALVAAENQQAGQNAGENAGQNAGEQQRDATDGAASAAAPAAAVAPPPRLAEPGLIAALPLLDAIDVAVTRTDFGLTLKAALPLALPGQPPGPSAVPSPVQPKAAPPYGQPDQQPGQQPGQPAGHQSVPVLAFRATRAELHLVLEALSRNAARAGWNLEPESGWLGKRLHMPEGATLTLN